MPAIIKTHPGHTNFFPPLLRRLLEAERRILEKCAYACYASDWAADAALEYYGAQFAPKIRVIPFGANMEVRRTSADIEEIIAKREPNACNLLFIGRYWNEKGGPIALATAEELHRRGLKVRLDLVGSQPAGSVPPYVRVHGFVSKKNAEGQRKLDELFRASHLLIVPTRFEAYGLVYVEASSYGLPSLGTAIGGVTTIIRKDANGRTFPLDACASNYADYAQALLKTPEKYHALSRSSFREFEQRLSWRKWGETVRGLAEPLLAGHRSEPALPK